MLDRLLEFGLNNGWKPNSGSVEQPYFILEKLGKLPKSCCPNSTTEVIDYDYTKRVVSQERKIKEPKSCDALKIMPDINRLDFIELKNLENMKKSIKHDCPANEQVKNRISNFGLDWKVEDSYDILRYILQSGKFNLTKEERAAFDKAEKNYIIAVDKDIEENGIMTLDLSLSFLAEASSELVDVDKLIVDEMHDAVDNIKPYHFLTNKPKLVSSKDIDDRYKNLCCKPKAV